MLQYSSVLDMYALLSVQTKNMLTKYLNVKFLYDNEDYEKSGAPLDETECEDTCSIYIQWPVSLSKPLGGVGG